jgi:hypothetical protein
LGIGLTGHVLAQAAAPSAVAGERREPTMRHIQPSRDAAALERIEFFRAKLPAQYRKRNNFAWAVAKIKGLDKTEYFAHSGIQNLDDLSSAAAKKVEGISLKPQKWQFIPVCVNQNDVVDGPNCWVRNVDTEYKILEDMAARLPDTTVEGRVRIYTDLPPCASCWDVMKQFLGTYPNIQMQVLYRER